MNKQAPLILSLIVSMLLVTGAGILRQSGSPGGRTDSPGDGENCTACHSGTASSVDDWIETDIPESGYVPGETYQITVTGSDDEASRMGFELTAELPDDSKTGTFIITDGDRTQLVNNEAAVTHTTEGAQMADDSNSWTAEWTAPENTGETIEFYAAVNAADGDGTNSGDQIYTTTTSAESSQATAIPSAAANTSAKLYPNPVNNVLTIQTSRAFQTLTLYAMNGKVVFQAKLNSKVSGGAYTIDLPGTLNGMYTLTLSGKDGTYTQTLLTE